MHSHVVSGPHHLGSDRKQGWDKVQEGVLTLPISAGCILQMPDGPGTGGGVWELISIDPVQCTGVFCWVG